MIWVIKYLIIKRDQGLISYKEFSVLSVFKLAQTPPSILLITYGGF